MTGIRLKAYAKINLSLDVAGQREDGYHLLESVMQSISLADQVTITKGLPGLKIITDEPGLAEDERNSAWQAAVAFSQATGIAINVAVEIKKEIPLAAGLGGGTSDGAAVLHGLNHLYGTKLSLRELQKIGLAIGADAPFCLQGGTAFVEGIGEGLTALHPLAPVELVVIALAEKVATATVYHQLPRDAFGTGSSRQLASFLQSKKPIFKWSGSLRNALEVVAGEMLPEIKIWKGRLLSAGAWGAVMSGSGPTVIGVFEERRLAEQFRKDWQSKAKIILAKPVTTGIQRMNGGNQP